MSAKFALVNWLGDPKPKCWQVISTSAVRNPPGTELAEGKTFDAIWHKDEETSPAQILKLGGKNLKVFVIDRNSSCIKLRL